MYVCVTLVDDNLANSKLDGSPRILEAHHHSRISTAGFVRFAHEDFTRNTVVSVVQGKQLCGFLWISQQNPVILDLFFIFWPKIGAAYMY